MWRRAGFWSNRPGQAFQIPLPIPILGRRGAFLVRDGPSASLTARCASACAFTPLPISIFLTVQLPQTLYPPPLSCGLAAPTGRAATPFDASSPGSSSPTTTHQVCPRPRLSSRCAKLGAPNPEVSYSYSDLTRRTGSAPAWGRLICLQQLAGNFLKRKIRFSLESNK
jgi:hypothetical protein